ncbi:coniferyl-alcohol dehydrogenase [Rhodobacteraceae bacterium N5(2021)]|uniref:Coniferyl-alcohol dehydrogenase n=1 Tax=Gymnodinialimonas phycosphaerae TaxID=2841589 RepID=A0A975YGK8_9RHOB|nr:coniferyl-alcohol dehydrogenase [Gymnodinialimonas phycosphaerae]MBY4891809.1 coniferyl-alcohol dehydrogenase [Gymnodinialimonas phycosphaerae]
MGWERAQILEGKTILVTGSASGIGLETARVCTAMGARVLGVDLTKRFDHVEEFYRADLSDGATIDALIDVLPKGIDGIANIAGLPPTAPADKVLAVNLFGLKHLTLGLIPKLNDSASIVNLASLAGFGWQGSIPAIRASETVHVDGAARFAAEHQITNEGGRSYFFSKEALVTWTMQNRWTWRDRGIRMNSLSPGPVDTPILGDFLETLGARAEEDARVMDRPGTPADLAPIIAFLLSDMTAWIRGTNIPADGGMSSNILCEMHGLSS